MLVKFIRKNWSISPSVTSQFHLTDHSIRNHQYSGFCQRIIFKKDWIVSDLVGKYLLSNYYMKEQIPPVIKQIDCIQKKYPEIIKFEKV